jgi:hypothetical protein
VWPCTGLLCEIWFAAAVFVTSRMHVPLPLVVTEQGALAGTLPGRVNPALCVNFRNIRRPAVIT